MRLLVSRFPAVLLLLALTMQASLAQSTTTGLASTRTPLEMLVNGNFAKADANWTLEQTATAKGQMSVVAEGPGGKPALRMTVQSVTDHQWHLQIYQKGLHIRKGTPYLLTFWAKSDQVGEIKMNCMQNHEPWEHHDIALPVTLTPKWQQTKFAFVAPYDDSDMRLQFTDLGVKVNQVYWFAGCSLVENPPSPKAPRGSKKAKPVSELMNKTQTISLGPHASGLAAPVDFSIDGWRSK